MTEMGWFSISNIKGATASYGYEELNGSSDRAAALIATSILDTHLGIAIKWHLRQDDKVFKELSGAGGPFGAFSSKIKVAYLLTLISKDCMSEMHVIRGIRNDFAHDFSSISFETQSIKDRTNNLHLYASKNITLTPSGDTEAALHLVSDSEKAKASDKPREKYLLTCKLFSGVLAMLCSGEQLVAQRESAI